MASISELSTRLDECCYRLAFVADFFGQLPHPKTPDLSYAAACGIIYILDDVQAHLRSVDTLARELISAEVQS